MCQVSPFKIKLLTYITLDNNQGYILIPENELSLNVNCLDESRDIVLREATLIRSNDDYILNSDSTIIKLKKTAKVAKHISYRENITIPISPDELNLLQDHLLPLQKQINNKQDLYRPLVLKFEYFWCT